MSAFWCERAWLPAGVATGVRVTEDGGRITSVEPGTTPEPGDHRLTGLVLPGLANAHSHAFHRALRGRTHDGGGTFWTWRERMYALAARLDPDGYLALARAAYAEMALAGVTCVGEFSYLHHGPGGVRYDDPNAMSEALVQAAADAGVRLTLLDTCYLAGGLDASGHLPLDEVQRRFSDGDAGAWAARVARLPAREGLRIGAAVHSVRAVPADQLAEVAAAVDGPLHVHLSEQPAENEACLGFYGRTPTALLAEHGVLGPRTTAVHAVHLTGDDVALLGGSATAVCACPTTEADLADGIGPFRELADAGSPLCLGSDQQVRTDLLGEAQALEAGQRLRTGVRGRFSPADLVTALTGAGHSALGWPDAGRLETGCRADLVAVGLDAPGTAGADPAQAVLVAGAADVRTVVVDGRVVVADGRHPLGDVGALLRDAIAALEVGVSTLVTGIAELVTNDPSLGSGRLGVLPDAALVVDGGTVAWVGASSAAPDADDRLDLGGRAVLPGFVDSHSHLLFAGDRSAEFEARMSGERYDGGGIASTVRATRAASDGELRARLARLLGELRAQGTTTVEVKSGYGLTVADEARALRLAAEVTAETTFLGAHVVPVEYAGRVEDYLALVTGPMLEACAPHARWIDVFCEPASPHAFDGDAARQVLAAGRAAGLELRVHANQLSAGPGVRLAVELGAASADHCTHLTGADVEALASGGTVATLLPGAEFSTRSPYPDARRLLDAGATVALATDCNPGTSFTSSMPFCIALAVREMGMTPAEAVWAATAGGAAALRRTDVGHLGVGARAHLALLDAPSYRHLAYRPGVPLARALDLPA